jgi:hypothetical protein
MVIVEPSLLAKTIFPARRVAVQVSYHAVRIINWAQAYAMFYKGTSGIASRSARTSQNRACSRVVRAYRRRIMRRIQNAGLSLAA